MITVVNLGGVVVGKSTAATDTQRISLQGCPRGSYLVTIQTSEGRRTHKFLKW